VRAKERGYSLIEVLVGVALLGIVMVPLGMATVVGYRTVFGAQESLSGSTDAQLVAAIFPRDVQSAGATGVNPTDPVNENTCAARVEDGETPLIMFVWDEDLGVNNQSVARYIAKGVGAQSQIIRRYCKGTASSEDTVVARRFGTGDLMEASLFTQAENGSPTPQCDASSCSFEIHGAYDLRVSADRRVPGSAPGALVPDAPTNVHAVGGNNRATVYWTDPADNGAPISSYYLEQTPGGTLLGPFSTTGLSGAPVNGLANGQSYTFRVRAANILGPGPFSEPSDPVTPGPTTPDAPTIGAATPDPAVNGRATIAWSLPPDHNDGGSAIVGFKVYAVHAPDEPVVVDVGDPATREAVVTGLDDNTEYRFQVSARNTYGEGSPSSQSDPALTLPGPPGTPTANHTGSGTVDLTFAVPPSGDFESLTRLRAHILESDTFTTPVDAATACPGATPTSCTLTVSNFVEGESYTITVQAENATGWGTESGAVSDVDLSPPDVTLTAPTGPWISTATPTFAGAAGEDPGDLPTITVKIYAGASTSAPLHATRTTSAYGNTWSYVMSPGLSQTEYTAVATQTDVTGNVGTSNTVTFSVDTTAPSGSVTAPSANAWVRGSSVTVSSDSSDGLSGVANATFQVSPAGAGAWTTISTDSSSPYAASWNTTGLADGDYDLRVVTTDRAFNAATSATRTVRVDNTDPTVGSANVTGTQGSNGWYTSNVTVTWPSPTDGGSGIASTSGCGTTGITSDTTGQTVTCSATDTAGNTASRSVTVKRDATSPSTATLGSLGTFVGEGKVLTGSGADATSGVESITYLYCAGTSCTPATTIGSSSTASTYPVTWTGVPANGSYQVLARVFDAAGNSRDSTKQTVTIDDTAPTGSITAPTANANLRGSVTVTANSSDSTSGVQSAAIQRSPALLDTWTTIVTDTSSPYTTSWNTSGVADGLYDLRVVTTDNAGNVFTSPLVQVRVDNTAPTVTPSISGTLGSNGWYVSDVTLSWSVSDGGSGIASTTGCSTTNVTTDTTGTDYTCSATDNAGNSGSDTRTIKRDTSTPTLNSMEMRDNDGDGKIDRVVVTFDQTLQSYTAGTAPWTLANVPSGGSLSSVSVSGSTATLTVTEGSGAKETAVGSFTVALATNANGIRDAAGNRSSFSASAPSDGASPVPVSAQLFNKSGGTNGKVEQGDSFTVEYSERLGVASLCSTWSNDSSDQSRTFTVTMQNSGSSDYLEFGSPCGNIGDLDTNRNYVTSDRTFSNSTATWDVSERTLRVTLGTPSGSTSSGVSSTAPTYNPGTGLADTAGNTMAGTAFTGTSSRF
jgi:prepilin-type N-terminal cleavage/methylation domain-containing protein